ncbi:MAG: hypothetical protein COV29_00995 [Candidatus Yanofskybacteria bacterium CG10_big_fil_rev_8_21_14_0_10_36_16]|uniref:HTH HARE-type domain-containing protein n=1 Tax=Candidatus Yanofskybacteria bacterium CG10_big_fil_rev_8_21_14_0_10_36_16 TaxID=1975096 RepID=A0A2J0Q840_9BACT|nr:MAG: hypothetical protein COV29_00995 [Candidatus Yanofskybacteria bacterium CG10_big_fil_rev_8_21_14_0_10_36_16]
MSTLNNNIKGVVLKVLKVLNTRNRDIISRRFGLKDGKRETLESIGQSYGITRERVRQIENASMKQIKGNLEAGLASLVEPYVNLAGSILEEHGGVMREEDLFQRFSGLGGNTPVNAALVFFLDLNSDFVREADDEGYHQFWSLNEAQSNSVKKALGSFAKAFSKKGVITESEVVNFYNKNVAAKDTAPKFVASLLSISKQIGRNSFGQVGLTSWPEIKPRGVRDMAYLVLKRDNKPRHFREIAELINDQPGWDKKANVQTVHNELIKDKRFVLVGRGLYALKEWGFKAGTVKDVIKDIIKSSSNPLSKNEIVNQVLSHRMVKENTVMLSLQDQKSFTKNNDGTYSLREA